MSDIAYILNSVEQDGVEIVPPVTKQTLEIVETSVSVGVQGLKGNKGDPGNILPTIFFDYGDATPKNISTSSANQIIKSISLMIVTEFNGGGAKISIGTALSPSLLMSEDENHPAVLGTFETSPNITISSGTILQVFITPGAGATTGRAAILIEYATA